MSEADDDFAQVSGTDEFAGWVESEGITRYNLARGQRSGKYVLYDDYVRVKQERDQLAAECTGCEAYKKLEHQLATVQAERDKFEKFNKETIADLCLVSDVLDKAGIPANDGYGCYSEEQRVEMLVEREATAQAAVEQQKVLVQSLIKDACDFEREMEERHGMQFTDAHGGRWPGTVVTEYIRKAQATVWKEAIQLYDHDNHEFSSAACRKIIALRDEQQAQQAREKL